MTAAITLSHYIFFAVLGTLPSVIWLFFYLRQDAHPEPKNTLFVVFLLGAAVGPIAIFIQYLAHAIFKPLVGLPWLNNFMAPDAALFLLNIIIFAPVSEEFLKYAVVKWHALKNPAFDEPVDAMIYLIVSALGFAAVENALNIFFLPAATAQTALSQMLVRFFSATLLHALASGLFGYFLAQSLFNFKKRKLFLVGGFAAAALFHSFYNYLAWLIKYNQIFVFALAVLLILAAAIVNWQFRRLKKQTAVCCLR